MSLTSRARALSRVSGMGHQQAVNAIRQLGPKVAEHAANSEWPLSRCDIYLIDPRLDPEYAAAWRSSRYVNEANCEQCNKLSFVGRDKKGGDSFNNSDWCPSCREEYGVGQCSGCCGEVLGGDREFCSNCPQPRHDD